MTENREIDRLISDITATLQRENWTDRPMTAGELTAVSLAVRHTLKRVCGDKAKQSS